MAQNVHPLVFGPLGRRITHLVASPDGRTLAFKHIPQNYSTDDYHDVLYRKAGDTYVDLGELPTPPPIGYGYSEAMQRADFAPLDDGQCLSLETGPHSIALARYAPAESGLVEAARWNIGGTLSLVGATLRLRPSGQEVVVHISDRDDKNVDWGGGPPPDFPQSYLWIDVTSGKKLEKFHITSSDAGVSIPGFCNPGGVSSLVSLGAPSWTGARELREGQAIDKILESLSGQKDFPIRAGRRRLLTRMRVIEIGSGQTLLQLADDEPQMSLMRVYPRFHVLSPDENHALSTVPGGHFELWNVTDRSSWRPSLPPHGGVHCAVFLPGARAALGTAEGGVIVVDCTPGLEPGCIPW